MPPLRVRRAAAQLLHRPAGLGAADVVRSLLAVQAQDLGAARLAIRARSQGLSSADVDAALSDERTLVVDWLHRGTLQLVAVEDHGWLHALTAPTRAAAHRRRLAQEGVSERDAERALEAIERALADEGPLTRPQLAERIAAAGVPTAGQAIPHLLGLAAQHGVAVLGPVRADGHAFVLARGWVARESSPQMDRDEALTALARRYLRGHGPATARDLAGWSGLPLRDARAGLEAIAGEVVEVGGDGLLDLADRAPPPRRIAPRLLGPFDPYLLGWRDRSFAVPVEHGRRVHPGGGMLRATAIADGLVVATWTRPRGTIELDPFAPLKPAVAKALRADAEDVARFAPTERPGPTPRPTRRPAARAPRTTPPSPAATPTRAPSGTRGRR
jgi:winged helix DNA-binding protein